MLYVKVLIGLVKCVYILDIFGVLVVKASMLEVWYWTFSHDQTSEADLDRPQRRRKADGVNAQLYNDMCAHIYIYIYIYTSMRVYIHIYALLPSYYNDIMYDMCIHTCVYIYIYICIHMYTHYNGYNSLCYSVYIYIYTYDTYIYIYMYTHNNNVCIYIHLSLSIYIYDNYIYIYICIYNRVAGRPTAGTSRRSPSRSGASSLGADITRRHPKGALVKLLFAVCVSPFATNILSTWQQCLIGYPTLH